MDHDRILAQAIDLMQRALGLLDASDETLAVCHLQQAIDIVLGEPPKRRN